MEKHSLIKNGYHYPIGTNIKLNAKAAKEMGEQLLFFVDEYYKNIKNIYLICTGSSGIIISTIVAEVLLDYLPEKHVEILCVQKKGENAHRGNFLGEYLFDPNNMTVIADDFIGSGNSVGYILNCIKEESGAKRMIDVLCIGNDTEQFNDDFKHIICNEY